MLTPAFSTKTKTDGGKDQELPAAEELQKAEAQELAQEEKRWEELLCLEAVDTTWRLGFLW